MNYIYDLKINLHTKYYDYHEWLATDKIIKVKKIPIIRVNDKTFKDIRLNTVKINNYSGIVAITNTKSVYIIDIKNKINKLFSSINISLELDILPMTKKFKETHIEYKILKKIKYPSSRNDEEKYNYLLNNLDNIDYDKLKYIFLECYNDQENNYSKIKYKIKNDIKNNNTYIIDKIYDILKLVTSK